MATYVWNAGTSHIKGVRKGEQSFWNDIIGQIDNKIIVNLGWNAHLKRVFIRKVGKEFGITPRGDDQLGLGATILFSSESSAFLLYNQKARFARKYDVKPRYLMNPGDLIIYSSENIHGFEQVRKGSRVYAEFFYEKTAEKESSIEEWKKEV